jgi:hypothetical protein
MCVTHTRVKSITKRPKNLYKIKKIFCSLETVSKCQLQEFQNVDVIYQL